jgi:Cu2+-exporting ATPase
MRLTATEWLNEGIDKQQLFNAVAAIEHRSEHSLAKALVESICERQNLQIKDLHPVVEFKALSGRGVRGLIDDDLWCIGTAKWLQTQEIELPQNLLAKTEAHAKMAQTAVWVAKNGEALAVLYLEDEIREDAKELIQRLKARGKQVTLLSGDLQVVAERVADQLGGLNVIAEVLPEDKNEQIRQLQQNGQKVAMVGDGINDAPALVRADVGIALGSGTDVSMESADIVLMNNQLISVDTAIALSIRTLRTVKQNIASSIAYNIVMVPLAMSGTLTPLIAAITMPLSSLVVIGNAARIRSFFNEKQMRKRQEKTIVKTTRPESVRT